MSQPHSKQLAWEALQNSAHHLLIIGSAGTGKSTLLNDFRRLNKFKHAVVAPTGIAALNVNGSTIHSFFRLWATDSEADIRNAVRRFKKSTLLTYQELDCLIIDEISMVRADLFDQINIFLQSARRSKLPFGGVRLIMFGDLYQLPPVVRDSDATALKAKYNSPYFFSSDAWQQMTNDLFGSQLEVFELQEVFRQQDPEFISFLEDVRHNRLQPALLEEINRRLVDETLDISAYEHRDKVVLTTTNRKADAINQMQLRQIESQTYTFKAQKTGKFEPSTFPTPDTLNLKKNARIMLINNDQDKRWINGTLGWIDDFIEPTKTQPQGGVIVRTDDERYLEVYPHTWETARTIYDQAQQNMTREVLGTYLQLPVKLAWAMTIHKSQGQTFEKVIIDLDWGGFATGQTYVALSRATSLQGINLIRPLRESDILIDDQIVEFVKELNSA